MDGILIADGIHARELLGMDNQWRTFGLQDRLLTLLRRDRGLYPATLR